MTKVHSDDASSSVQLSSRERLSILDNVLAALQKRFYSPEKLNDDWRAAVERHRPLIEGANTADSFEKAMSDLLSELHTSHLGSFTALPAGHQVKQRSVPHTSLMRQLSAGAGYFKMSTREARHRSSALSPATSSSVSMAGTLFHRSTRSFRWANNQLWSLWTEKISSAQYQSMWRDPKGRSFNLSSRNLSRHGFWEMGWAT